MMLSEIPVFQMMERNFLQTVCLFLSFTRVRILKIKVFMKDLKWNLFFLRLTIGELNLIA